MILSSILKTFVHAGLRDGFAQDIAKLAGKNCSFIVFDSVPVYSHFAHKVQIKYCRKPFSVFIIIICFRVFYILLNRINSCYRCLQKGDFQFFSLLVDYVTSNLCTFYRNIICLLQLIHNVSHVSKLCKHVFCLLRSWKFNCSVLRLCSERPSFYSFSWYCQMETL